MTKPDRQRHSILLIQPPSTLQELQRLKSRRPEIEPPLPFVYISPYLLDAGFQVHILDLRIDSISMLKVYLQETTPLVVGISVMPGSMLRDTIKLTKLIKCLSPSTKVVWGGTFPSLHYQICLQVKELDFVACGDGEITLTELTSALAESTDKVSFENIKGLAYIRDGLPFATRPREPVDLERQPIGAWHLLEKYMPWYLNSSRLLAINTARGCPYRCTFCYNTAIYRGFNRYRTKSIDAVIEEVSYLHTRYSPRVLIFMDDDFLANRKRGYQLLGTINRKFPDLRYRIDARVNELKEGNTVKELAGEGLESVFFGVEGVSGEFLNRIKKGCETDDTFEAAKRCEENGIAGTYSFTCGYPNENFQELFDRVDMANLLTTIHRNSRCQMEIISPIIGTSLYSELDQQNLIPHDSIERWCHFSDWKSAADKAWITDGPYYEAFQLAFYIAFSSGSSLDGGLRTFTQLLSSWAKFRLNRKRPAALSEFRAVNYLLKKIIWRPRYRHFTSGERMKSLEVNYSPKSVLY
jgi:anaerobic magnesium-protoporphyrin IX monomethyl ester cyclase